MTASLNMPEAEAALQKEHDFSSALRRFLEYGKGRLLNASCETPPLPEATDFEPLASMLAQARDAFAGDLTLGLDGEDGAIVIPLLAAFTLGSYACEAADRLIAATDHTQDVAMKDIAELSDDIGDLPFGRLIPLNEWRRELLGRIPQEHHFLFPWLTECVSFDSDSLERIVQAWDGLWSGTAGDDAEALVPVLTAIQSDTALMDHLKSEARFHASALKAAGELARQRHMERARKSAGQGTGVLDRIVSWFRMPAVSGVLALVLMVGVYFATQVGRNGQSMPLGVTMEMLVYQDGLTVRGGEEAEPEVRKPGDAPLENGDAIRIRFILEEPAYVYLYHQNPTGKNELLFSGKQDKGIHIFPSDNRQIRIVKPDGNESFTLLASPKPLSEEKRIKAMNGQIPSSSSEMAVIDFNF